MAATHASSPLPEPKTPMWLPALGAALFIVAAIAFFSLPSSESVQPEPAASASASAAASAAPPPAPQPPPQAAQVRAQPQPAQSQQAAQGQPARPPSFGANNANAQKLLDQIHNGQNPKK